jgi:oxygen-independent coproporphyrinogen-3 oxidase
MTSLAIYVHFPFCLSICPYCDFDRQATGFDRVDTYLAAVVREMRQYASVDQPVHSVFFGGGTPSLMRPDQVFSLLEAVARTWRLQEDAEITLECNPGDADLPKLRAFRAAGVNRLSIGVQSLDDAFLKTLGRRHSSATARHAAAWAAEVGFNFNLDFMFGLPGQSLEHWANTLEQAVALEPDHLSCYLLTLDERLPMGRDVARGRLVLPEDDDVAAMYDLTRQSLAAAEYQQYEISNWSKPGRACRHNLTYWRDEGWIGIGAGAASSHAGRRWKNTPVLERYITSVEATGRAARVEDEQPDLPAQQLDFLALGLRLRKGAALSTFRERFGIDALELLGQTGDWLLESGFLELADDCLTVPAEHQLITSAILVRIDQALRESSSSQIAVR